MSLNLTQLQFVDLQLSRIDELNLTTYSDRNVRRCHQDNQASHHTPRWQIHSEGRCDRGTHPLHSSPGAPSGQAQGSGMGALQ